MNLRRVAVRGLRAQLQQAETCLFLAALLFAVAALTAVQFGAQRMLALLGERAAAMNGGDLSVGSRTPLPETYAAEARHRGLAVAQALSFPSMLFAGEAQQLVDIKAVAGDYPVRGTLRVRAGDGIERDAHAPAPGTAFADARVLDTLGIDPEVADRAVRDGYGHSTARALQLIVNAAES